MEQQEFDQLARESVGASTRRTVVRGLAAALGVSGLGLALSHDADAGRNKKNKRKQRKKKQKKNQECGSDGKTCEVPLNP